MSDDTVSNTAALVAEVNAVQAAPGRPRADDVFKNWETLKISGVETTRSSCPNYKGQPPFGAGGSDSQQNMNDAAVKILKDKKVTYVISANEIELDAAQRKRLSDAGIGYKHEKVADFGVPTETQFKDVHRLWKAAKHCHLYCGWGHGRTGTYVSGIQILEGVYKTQPKEADYKKNHVEADEQMQALDALWKWWNNNH